MGKTLEEQVPAEYRGTSFGPKLITFVMYQYYKCRVPHRKIIEMLLEWRIEISKGTLCSILNSNKKEFVEDLKSARDAGIKKSSQVHIDDTRAKFNGALAHTFAVSNEYFTSFTTLFSKNRWSATGAILGGEERFLINSEAISFIAKKLKRAKVTVHMSSLKSNHYYSQIELDKIFEDPVFKDVYKKQRDIIRTACAISALRSGGLGPPVRFLISDDARNFKNLVKNHQLCWVHEIRRYKLTELYKEVALDTLEKLLVQWRKFYNLMKRFRNNQTQKLREKIRSEFDRITSLKTLIRPIDEQLIKTKSKKEQLLLFLRYPQLPLHNNLSENDLRERVLKRKISLQNRSLKGVKAWDLMLSLLLICREIGLNFWKYLEDRISKKEEIHYLGHLTNQL
ncbi:transposase [bacterium]|nr:transposase [bacterium]